jgi:phosphohistidine phosphatase SixA
MPLKPGPKQQDISDNIRKLRKEGYTEKEAVAIAMKEARKVPEKKK